MNALPAPPRMTARDGGVHNGITWATCNAPLWGAVNGYVLIPTDHPWHGKDYDDIDTEAPGGLTFSSDGWIGFDTLHGWDRWPDGDAPHFCFDGECDCIIWTPEKAAEETRTLADRVAAARAGGAA